MKLLLDQDLSWKLVEELGESYPDSKHIFQLLIHSRETVSAFNGDKEKSLRAIP